MQDNLQQRNPNFPYTIITEQSCEHETTFSVPVFECCNQAFPCKQCHNKAVKHKRGKIKEIYCKSCFKIHPVKTKSCNNCGVSFGLIRVYNGDKKDENADSDKEDVSENQNNRSSYNSKYDNREEEFRGRGGRGGRNRDDEYKGRGGRGGGSDDRRGRGR